MATYTRGLSWTFARFQYTGNTSVQTVFTNNSSDEIWFLVEIIGAPQPSGNSKKGVMQKDGTILGVGTGWNDLKYRDYYHPMFNGMFDLAGTAMTNADFRIRTFYPGEYMQTDDFGANQTFSAIVLQMKVV